MTTATIDHISINDDFWIQLKEHLISFGFGGLPKGIHLTIAFNDNSPDINFHISKNTEQQTKKPQICIAIIDKKLLEELLPALTLSMLNKVLKPVNIEEIKTKFGNELGFISFDEMEKSETYSLTEQKLVDSFKDISKFRRKTRLKIEGDIEKQLENFATSEELYATLQNNIVDLSPEFNKPVEGGIILSEENALTVIRINKKWFSIKTKLRSVDLMTAFVNPELAKRLIRKTKRAIVRVKNAKTFEDTEPFNKPIRLVKVIQNKSAN